MNRAGTVGVPIPGVEVKIAADGEILTRGPHVMLGYYRSPEKTREVIDAGGWFHTGDIGRFDEDGHLRITDRKKDLFKLSTGKYVMPQPLEHRLGAEVLIDHAVVTGSNKPYCTALIFPSESALRTLAETYGLPSDRPLKSYFEHPRVVGRFQKLVDKANQGIERWSTIKRFTLLDEPLTVEGGLLTPTMKVKRSLLSERFADVIEAMYSNHETVPEQD
jgi:long-chain acyl-CoA synthetase